MACACQRGKKDPSSFTVTKSDGSVVGTYRVQSEAQAAARKFPGSVIRSNQQAA